MDFWTKVEHFKKDMKARGGWWELGNAVPPYCRLAWMLRIKVRPPYFLSFWRCAIGMGVGFTVLLGLPMWFFNRPDEGLVSWGSALPAVLAGAAFGVVMAWSTRHKAKELGLPAWEEYPAELASQDT